MSPLTQGLNYRSACDGDNILRCLQPIPLWTKKNRELWSTNEKVIDVPIDPPKRTFFSRLYFGPRGVLRPEIFTCARD